MTVNVIDLRRPARVLTVALALTFAVTACSPSPEPPPGPALDFSGEWPQWRGPSRDGWVRGEPAEWPAEGLQTVWRRDVGPGFSAVSISAGRLFTTGVRGSTEWAIALDPATGRELWRGRLGERYESFHGDGPRSTPAVKGGTVVALAALGDLVAFDAADGTELWRDRLLERSGGQREDWGFASSPLIDAGRVFVHGTKGVTALALSLEDGEVLWQLKAGSGGYASPRMIDVDGQAQLLSFLGSGLFALDPGSGEVLWKFDYSTFYDLHAADPVVLAPGEFFISSNYATGAALVDVGEAAPSARWQNPRVRNHWASSVAVEGTIYGFDKTFLIAVDPEDGEVLWKQRGFGEGALLAVDGGPLTDGRLLIVGEDGDVALVHPDPTGYAELGRGVAEIDGPVRAAPVLVGGLLFIRGKEELVALRWGPRPVSGS